MNVMLQNKEPHSESEQWQFAKEINIWNVATIDMHCSLSSRLKKSNCIKNLLFKKKNQKSTANHTNACLHLEQNIDLMHKSGDGKQSGEKSNSVSVSDN